ncbi:MFS transporter [Dactylosporangium sp. CS-033363]|uniref:MFS transporter n=1 Tax=Dactylosporangium sp. CS-033363 TaxID=3239935 RepID=UPI003D92CC8A
MTTLTIPAPARPRRALTGISLGYFMVLLDMTVLAVAEPDLARSLSASTAGLQWATTAYTVTFAALLLSAGAATDRYGAPRLFRTGIAVFTAASLLSALAPALWPLVALRAVMGVAAAACVPASMSMIAALYPAPAARAKAIATWAATSGAAVAAGPIAGGALVATAGWRAVFLINVPIGALVLLLTAAAPTPARATTPGAAPASAAVAARTATPGSTSAPTPGSMPGSPALPAPITARIDWCAHLAATATLALATDTLIAAGAHQWPHTFFAALATAVALALFAALERRSPTPVFNRPLLREHRVRAALLAGATVNFVLAGILFVLPLYLHRAHHFTPLQTGLAFLPLTIPFVAGPPLTGRIVARVGPYRPILTGLALLTCGAGVLAFSLAVAGGLPLLATGLLAAGSGVSFALPALATAIVNAAPPGTTGAAAAVLNASRQAGASAGVVTMGAALSAGPAWPMLAAAAVTAATALAFAHASPARQR